uniref:CRIB domain-containing protein n=1 Tax=Kalanchoe fedtschenkoi TaxID=63787 RepID=A0A7N0TQT8_KALFE
MVSAMGSKIKGIYKGFKYISQMFAVKERELEIGYPTDVKHVAHIGWDGPSGTAPSWMNEIKFSAEFSSTSLGSFGERRDPNSNAYSTWSSQDFEESVGRHQPTQLFKDSPSIAVPIVPKKHRRKRNKSSSSPKSFN